MTPERVPEVTFRTRVRNDALGGPNPFEWKDVTTSDLFAGKRVVLFAVPGAFTPACSDSHLPGFERRYEEFQTAGVDAVICLAVNDAFVMFNWAKSRNIEKVFMLPDGNGDFSRRMGLLVERKAQGMGDAKLALFHVCRGRRDQEDVHRARRSRQSHRRRRRSFKRRDDAGLSDAGGGVGLHQSTTLAIVPGLVPGIHVVRSFVDCRTNN